MYVCGHECKMTKQTNWGRGEKQSGFAFIFCPFSDNGCKTIKMGMGMRWSQQWGGGGDQRQKEITETDNLSQNQQRHYSFPGSETNKRNTQQRNQERRWGWLWEQGMAKKADEGQMCCKSIAASQERVEGRPQMDRWRDCGAWKTKGTGET